MLLLATACSGDDDSASSRPTRTTRTQGATAGTNRTIVVRGSATLDGEPFDAQFMGAVVRHDGLVTPCQGNIPAVRRGRFEITVLGATDGRGCGTPGADVLLWTFTNKQLYSTRAVAWPSTGRAVNFDPTFSTATPNGDSQATSPFSGEVFDARGRRLGSGARVEAFVGGTKCATASVRRAGDFVGYIINVVGPDSIAGCVRNGTITFWVNDRQANQTARNSLDRGATRRGDPGLFNLTLP